MPVWRRGADFRIVACNPAYAAAVEAPVEKVIAEGRMLGGPQVAAKVLGLAQLARTAMTSQSEPVHVVVGGARRLLDVTEAPLADGGTIGVAIDVTDREELQRELGRIVAAHGDVLENLQTAIAVFGADTRLKFFNTAFARLWKLDEHWLRGEPDMNTLLEELRAHRRLPEYADFRDFKRQRIRLFTSIIEPIEELTYIPDGTTLRQRIMPHPLGGLLFTYEDVTDNLVLERSYNTLIAVQRETIDNLQEGIAVVGSDGRLKLSNPVFQRLWGFTDDIVSGEPHIGELVDLTRSYYAGPDPWEVERERLIARLTDRTPRRERAERADGIVLDLSSVPLPDGAVLLSYVDVTDSTRVELALRERASALETADRLKSEFISSVSYELRTPLNTIIGFAEILANRYFGDLNPRQLEYCRDIISSSHRLLTIINDILDLASIEAGRLTLERQPVDARVVVESAVQIMSDWARSADLTLRMGESELLPPLDADERRLKQALCNLISNAIKFTPPGGTITVTAARHDDRTAALSVVDTGVGIPSEYHEKVFREFERLRQRDQRAQGAGLGLSLVRRIVELHGGRVLLDSRPTQGTNVTCLVPFTASPVENAAE
ncbi:MAG: PAS-domain containing protein [Alphaproteobacteria bacterium]|nr:PAS-domain containing protein [Alphaproteobacteria bacterium]